MITVELCGGLGNQMFQYACGRALSLRRGDDLQIHTERVDKDPIRHYSLDCFPNICVPLTQRVSGFILEERSTRYEPEILMQHPGKDVFLRGFWQSEKYFEDVSDIIRKDFATGTTDTLRSGLKRMGEYFGASDQEVENAFCDSVAIHVRRGDYVSDPVSVQIMGNLPMDYYAEAMQQIKRSVPKVRFCIFTDDPEWCEKNFTPVLGGGINKGQKDFQDLFQMAIMAHGITANSSFSWWGRWLAAPGGITIAPKKWFASRDSSDVCPQRWLLI